MFWLIQSILAQGEALAAPAAPATPIPSTGNQTLDTLLYIATGLAGLHSLDKAAFWVQKFKGLRNGNGAVNGHGNEAFQEMGETMKAMTVALQSITTTLQRMEGEIRDMRVELAAKRGGL